MSVLAAALFLTAFVAYWLPLFQRLWADDDRENPYALHAMW